MNEFRAGCAIAVQDAYGGEAEWASRSLPSHDHRRLFGQSSPAQTPAMRWPPTKKVCSGAVAAACESVDMASRPSGKGRVPHITDMVHQ